MRRCLTPSQVAEIIVAYKNGARFMALVRQYNIGTSTLARLLKDCGLKRIGRERRMFSRDQEMEIVELYKTGETSTDLASAYQCSGATIIETLIRYGVSRRKRGTFKVTAQHRQQRSENAKRRWKTEEIRRKYLPILLSVGFKRQDEPEEPYPSIWNREYRAFRNAVLERDGRQCVKCGARKALHVHHKLSRKKRPDLIWDPSNVETLCRSCHMIEEANSKHAN